MLDNIFGWTLKIRICKRTSKKESFDSTDYTGGFKITVESDGTFIAVRAKNKTWSSTGKINKRIDKEL